MIITETDARFNKKRYRLWVNDSVRFSDLDPLGHVNNNAMGTYFENIRTQLYAIAAPEWPWRNTIFVLVRSTTDFCHELHRPADIEVGICVKKIGTSSITLCDAIFWGDVGIAYSETISVLIDSKTRRPVPLPDDMKQILSQYLDGTP